jgi:SagB-type dehydrogenase family enzyme
VSGKRAVPDRPALLLALAPDVAVAEADDGRLCLAGAQGTITLATQPPGLVAAARTLAAGGATEEQLAATFLAAGGPEQRGADGSKGTGGTAAMANLSLRLQLWWRMGLLRSTLVVGGAPLATVVPMARGVPLQPHAPLQPGSKEATTRWRLSRFAYLRREDDALVLESPRAPARVLLPAGAGPALVAALVEPRTAAELGPAADHLGPKAIQAFLALLASASLIKQADEAGALAEDADPTLRQWEFHDLLFHARSRRGRHDYPFGATYRFLDRLPPLPAVVPPRSGDVVPLYAPDLEHLSETDPPFTAVLEARRSIRQYGERPITAPQLGEFLYRVARVRPRALPEPPGGRPYEVSSRPYPSGGATYDLELYVTVNACEDLPAGLYHYDPRGHQLERLAERTADVDALLRDAQASAGLAEPPQVLITLASRFQRLSWKYAAMAYATTLKNVGVLYQTMYLVATAMGLAPCALGGGDADLFTRAAGTDYYAESSVGEFMLGSAPTAG